MSLCSEAHIEDCMERFIVGWELVTRIPQDQMKDLVELRSQLQVE